MQYNVDSFSSTRKSEIFGVQISALNMQQTLKRLEQLIQHGTPQRHLAVNAAKLVEAYENPDTVKLFNGAAVISADGQSVVWASRILGVPLPERVAGIDVMEELIKLSAEKGYRIYLLGATQDVVKKVSRHFEIRGAVIAGYNDGYWRKTTTDELMAAKIRQTKPDIVFVAVPSPMKEEFISGQLNSMAAPLCVGVGGSFDVVAGTVRRAPVSMQRLGLEWFYRFLQEPRRMFKRYLIGNTKFVYYVFRTWTQSEK